MPNDLQHNHGRILIDGFNLALEEGTGIATYARNLSYSIHALGYDCHVLYGNRAGGRHNLMREVAFFDPARVGGRAWWAWWELLLEGYGELRGAVLGTKAQPIQTTGAVIRTPFQSRLPYYDQLWNARNIFGRADMHFDVYRSRARVHIPEKPRLAHWTYPLPIRVPGTKNIYTIHDLVPLRLPYTTLDIKRRFYRKVRMICRRADHIVTVSETSRRDIINLMGVNESRVTNTYQAVSIPDKFLNKPEEAVRREVEGTFNLTYKGYLLFYGAIEPKKNVGRLIEAYLGSHVDTPLLIVGRLAWKSEQEMRILNEDVVRYLETVDRLTLTRARVQRVDYAPFPLLVSLIRGAKAVLFPSLYEGFGLPALEAMRLGTPVLTSTGGSMPEVAGDAAILVDPFDTFNIAEGIRAIDSNSDLRGELTAKGLRQAELFSQARYEERLDALYRRVLASPFARHAEALLAAPEDAVVAAEREAEKEEA